MFDRTTRLREKHVNYFGERENITEQAELNMCVSLKTLYNETKENKSYHG
jgi:hypothetical protein